MDMIIYTDQDHDSQCKRCAIIAVDEILKLNKNATLEILKFYKEVKEQLLIEKSK